MILTKWIHCLCQQCQVLPVLLIIICAVCPLVLSSSLEDNHTTSEVIAQPIPGYKNPVLSFIYDPGLTVKEILRKEQDWHWHPWRHIRYDTIAGGDELVEQDCQTENSLDDLPEDLFTRNNN